MDDADDGQAVAAARRAGRSLAATRATPPAPAPAPIDGSRPSTIRGRSAFETLGLEPSLIEGIRIRGFTSTTPIQSAVIPIVMDGNDLIGCADTGTGKTAAFLLPILNRMLRARATAPEERGFTRVLILAPTRELCGQIEDDVQGFTYHTDLTSIAVYGGVPMDPQERALKSGVDIVVATPGRLMDHMRNGAVKFDKLDTLVLDEADRMMDMGFWPDVRRIVAALPDTAARQTLLFSATMPEEVMRLADEVVCDAKFVQVGSAGGPPRASPTRSRTSPRRRRPSGSRSSCAALTGRCSCSCGRSRAPSGWRAGWRRAASRPRRSTPTARRHSARRRSKDSAAAGYRVLVATDVAARGLDIDGITHVVNYEVPSNRETYVHRVGRTGRAEATGTALTLVAPEELRALQALQRSFGLELQG